MENRYRKINVRGTTLYPQPGKVFVTRVSEEGELTICERSIPVFQRISGKERKIIQQWMESRKPKNQAECSFFRILKVGLDTISYDFEISVNWAEENLKCSPNEWRKMAEKEDCRSMKAGIATIEEYVLVYSYARAMGEKQVTDKAVIVTAGCAFVKMSSMEENVVFITDPWKPQDGIGVLVVR